ncbi:MAG: hypothetical protein ACK41V_08790 [Acidovorax sp.]|uniref:hypothetical protein n=1 Tax=Acidovorax sp. TaxID=1872122 RepID=UPI00391E03B3
MPTQITSNHLRDKLIHTLGEDDRTEGRMPQIAAAIIIQERPDLLTGPNWDLLIWSAINGLPPECQAAILDAVSEAKVEYRIPAHVLGSSAF